jgi:hypothetical protein
MISTREQWLMAAVQELDAPVFKQRNLRLPPVKVSCGWTGRGRTKTTRGQCWRRAASAVGVNEVFVSPILDAPFAAIQTLAHELVHAVDDCVSGHHGRFREIALAIGLLKPVRTARAGPELTVTINAIVDALGPYPHARLDFEQRPRQTARLHKCWCASCGYTCRVTALWLDTAGPPICPADDEPMDTDHVRRQQKKRAKAIPANATMTDDELDGAILAARAEMGRAHPDKGGDHEAFLAARARFDALAADRERRRGANRT